ncbi:regulatory protein, luxR family [Tranquillimonas rosea]|uniref:Regulatory protein, luxR family n=1 Tax=Tranquillimonas rosea TaxID=641238 RepID=A0A1H9SBL1_9RHOB|nr:regulatory protein, luxR family [Tranquillimonas rosea]
MDAFIAQVQAAGCLDELTRCVVALRDAFEIDHLVYHSVNSAAGQYAAHTYRESWVQQYVAEDYARIDPVVQGCLRGFHPIDWKDLDWSGKVSRAFLGEAISAGVGNQGCSVPIRGPSGQFALFSASHRGSDREWSLYRQENLGALILAAHYLNQKALELERGSDRIDAARLSPREVDVLCLLALGQSRARAAEALSISEHTLRVYIESARLKLNAVNTTQAVARAMSSGLLLL